ncbi:MAG: phospholipid carrier-dependent glycosyltransferase [Actinomycetota bacterium]|nr:phospholipid carrier-dependent glycosyltransferase [Actinomycetota bacterium]
MPMTGPGTWDARPQRHRGLASALPPYPWLRTHRVFAVVLAIAVIARVVTWFAYGSSLLYPDSINYLQQSQVLHPEAWHPLGYPFFVAAFGWVHNIGIYAVLNHLLGLGTGILLYATLLRLGVRPWLAAIGTAPALLDSYIIMTEQYILSDPLSNALLVAAFSVLVWRGPDRAARPPSAWRCAAAALLLAAGATTRFDTALLVVPAAAFLAARRVLLRRIATMIAIVCISVVSYASWYDVVNGHFTTSTFAGLYLYARESSFATCQGITVPPDERSLCIHTPPSRRPDPNWYLSSPKSPAKELMTAHPAAAPAILESFDLRILEHQPLDYAATEVAHLSYALNPTRSDIGGAGTQPWRFSDTLTQTSYGLPVASTVARFGGAAAHPDHTLVAVMEAYQVVFWVPGPVYGLALVMIVAALWQRRSRASGTAGELVLLSLFGISVIFFAVSTALFEWRYTLPLIVTLPAAAALAAEMLVSARRADRTTGAGRHRAGRAAPSPTQPDGSGWPLDAAAGRPRG